ncbi:putative DNA primase/helicase [Pseudomonas syringae]|uniref:VapE domain-containing protein n=1 Tax=Pseudomonas syringae TaxID=317 RepID=UPI0008947757|nr:VapE domain-containing protein [Pseudomonas syringae]SDW37080.1 putative DNA primase/helicase [Pseudomonas syringae]SFL65583.1 putative DNA primase/helicase [Pseudomonas syringae]
MNMRVTVSHQTAMDQLLAAMAAEGIRPTDTLLANGKLERFHVEGDRVGTRNGWGCFHFDAAPAAQFGCKKRHGEHKFSWSAERDTKPMSAAERKAQQAEWDRRKAEKADAERKRHTDAAARANAQWDAAAIATDDHPYLKRKVVKAHGLRVGPWQFTNEETGEIFTLTDNALLVPICDKSRTIHSLQAIFPGKILGKGEGARDKDFTKGGRKAGLFHVIGKPQTVDGRAIFVLAEGYATGATIHEITGHCVLVCFDAGNLLPVAEAIRSNKADAIIVIAADNDQWTTTSVVNPGVHFATRAAAAVGGLLAVPMFPSDDPDQPTDFNDLRCLDGVDAVRSVFDTVFADRQGIQDQAEAVEAVIDDAPPAWQEEMPDNSPWPSPVTVADEDDDAPAAGAASIHGCSIMQAHDFPDLSAKLRPLNTIPNLAALMRNFKITARYNMISKETELTVPGIWGTADNAQNVNLAHLNSLAAHCGLPRENLTEYVKAIADANAYNPVVEWVDSKPWDGVSRIQELADTLVCTNPEFRTLLLRRWLISCAAGLVHKGFWTKGVLTLHGAQDLGKTSWFRRLVPADLCAFREGVSLDATSKDSVMTAVSHWIVELGELESTLRRDMENLKAFISQTTDRLRRPYDRVDSEYPRRTVFCASVNSEKFLKDDTGNGRFWVIAVEAVKHDHDIDMQQLWAEVMSLYRGGEQWHLTPVEKTKLNAGNEKFRQVSPIEEMLTTNYDLSAPAGRWITATQLLLEMGYDKPNRGQTTETGQMMHSLGVLKRTLQGRTVYRIPEKLLDSSSYR